MNTRKMKTPYEQPHPYLELIPRMVIPFSVSKGKPPGLEICYLDYALVRLLRATNASAAPLSIVDLVVNNEFEPGAALTDEFQLFRYPIQIFPGASFEAILQPPSTANLPFDCAYPKLPVSLVAYTSLGNFKFHACEPIQTA